MTRQRFTLLMYAKSCTLKGAASEHSGVNRGHFRFLRLLFVVAIVPFFFFLSFYLRSQFPILIALLLFTRRPFPHEMHENRAAGL